jgi:uroporphyrinogen decarboxylase
MIRMLDHVIGLQLSVTGDGAHESLLCSPRTYRKWFMPRLDRIFAAVRRVNPEAVRFLHRCGNIAPVIGDLIEVGVQIFNPIHPETMDRFAIKRE